MRKIIKFRIFLWSLLLLSLGFFLWQRIVPLGRIVYVSNLEHAGFIGELKPTDRVISLSAGKKIIDQAVYFTTYFLRRFSQGELVLRYRNPDHLPIIEAGVLMNKDLWQYALQPVENNIIEKLSKQWFVLQDNNLILLQKKKKYQSIDDFLQHLPAKEKIALYHYDLPKIYSQDKQENQKQVNQKYNFNFGTIVKQQISGPYRFYTYLAQGPLAIRFSYQDLNLRPGLDNIEISVFNSANQLIAQRKIEDKGVKTIGQAEPVQEILFQKMNLPPGVYRFEFTANNDILTTKINSKQKKLVFIKSINLVDSDLENIKLFTNSKKIKLQANLLSEQESGQVNSQSFIVQPGQTIIVNNHQKIGKIDLKHGGVIISGKLFSFSQDAFFNPDYEIIDQGFQLTDNIEYILADYQLVSENNGWKERKLKIDFQDAQFTDQGYLFLIFTPGLNPESKQGIILKNIQIELKGKTLWQKLAEII